MAKIVWTMSNGQAYLQSEKNIGDGPFEDRISAQVEMKMLLEKYAWFSVDGGEVLIKEHIASAKIVKAHPAEMKCRRRGSAKKQNDKGGRSHERQS